MIYADLTSSGTLENLREGPCPRAVGRCRTCKRPIVGAKPANLCVCDELHVAAIVAGRALIELPADDKRRAELEEVIAKGELVARDPDDGCTCAGPHNDPAPGTVRVELARLPLEGEAGPFRFEAGLPIPDAAATRRAALDRMSTAIRERALAQALRAELVTFQLPTDEADAVIESSRTTIETAAAVLKRG